jgi:hypothetical protein
MLRAARSLRRIGQLIHAQCDAASRKTLAPAAGTQIYPSLFFIRACTRAQIADRNRSIYTGNAI